MTMLRAGVALAAAQWRMLPGQSESPAPRQAPARREGHPVPFRALSLSLLAMVGAIAAAVYWPAALLEQQVLAGGLALMPALLLAHYRRWTKVTLLLGAGLVVLSAAHLSAVWLRLSLNGSLLIPLLLAPYIAIALGAGWFGEVRRYQAELQATQLQLIQSEKLDSIGRIAAGVAHEVKNPLMILLTGSKILSKRLANADEPTRTVLADMVDAIERADRIIGGLLSYSRDGAVDLAPADLNDVIEQSLLLVKHEIDMRRTRVATALDASLPALMLDRFKMQQVLVNVITNALHAMEEGGEIRIRTSLDSLAKGRGRGGRVAVVRIEDSGPGIAPVHLDKIFDPFFTTKPAGSGTGLGLSVARQIVEMHGGTINICNRDAGGAQVTISLSLTETEHDDGTTNPARR